MNKAVNYKYTGILDVEKTVREIRDSKENKKGNNGHSKYLWEALELRNDGLDDREIAKELSQRSGTSVAAQQITRMFKGYSIEPNPSNYVPKGREGVEIKIMDKETFDTVDKKSLRTGVRPSKILMEDYSGKIGDKVYNSEAQLRKVWNASYAYYMK